MKCTKDNTDVLLALQNLRNTPRSEELGSANQRLMSRITRTQIPMNPKLLQPKIIRNVQETLNIARHKQKEYGSRGSKEQKPLAVNQQVRIQTGPRKWVGGKVIKHLDVPRSVIVRTDDERHYRRNTHHVHSTKASMFNHKNTVSDINPEHTMTNNISLSPSLNEELPQKDSSRSHNIQLDPSQPIQENTYRTRSGRTIKPVNYRNI